MQKTDDGNRFFLFIKCPQNVLRLKWYHSKLTDWLKGIGRLDSPPESIDTNVKFEKSSKSRIIHELLDDLPVKNSGSITLFSLHDKKFNRNWIATWSTKFLLNLQDFTQIKSHFGEHVAFYFVFLQFYFVCLLIPALMGIISYFHGKKYSSWMALGVGIWSLVFVQLWKRQEQNLSVYWCVENAHKHERKRFQFRPDNVSKDPVTGETNWTFSRWKRWLNMALIIPVLVAMAALLLIAATAIFMAELVFTEYYNGPFASTVKLLPLIAYVAIMPALSNMYTFMSKKLNDFENHPTDAAYDFGLVKKLFVSYFVVNFSFPLLNGLLYIPFGDYIASYFEKLNLSTLNVKELNSQRFEESVVAFILTGQVLNLFTELIFPVTGRILKRAYASGEFKFHSTESLFSPMKESSDESLLPSEDDVIAQALDESELEDYDINVDFTELVMQFGYVVIFSPVWPLTSLAALINNWFEIRSDMLKICFNNRRPIPRRIDTIGPWVDNLRILSWIGIIFSSLWILLFQFNYSLSKDFTSIAMILMVVENAILALEWIIQTVMSSFASLAELQAKRSAWTLKQKYLEQLKRENIPLEDHKEVNNLNASALRESCSKKLMKALKADGEKVE